MPPAESAAGERDRRRTLAWAALLLLSGCVYAASLDYLFFGRLTDDARHFVAARSLLRGSYRDLSHPDEPPLVVPPPGYPALLLPAAALDSPRAAQWTSLLFMLASVWVLLRLLAPPAGAGSGRLALAVAALTALHPLSVVQAVTVMAEAPYLFFTLLALLRLSLIPKDEPCPPARAAELGALAAWCVWLRPQGAALALAAWAVLSEGYGRGGAAGGRIGAAGGTSGPDGARSWAAGRPGLVFAGTFLCLAAAPFARNWLASGVPAQNFTELPAWGGGSGMGAAAATLSVVLHNLARYPFLVGGEALLDWVAPLPGADSAVSKAAGLAVLAAAAAGARESLRGGRAERAAALYVVAYAGLHLFWVNQFRRYVFPILPLLYWFALRGAAALAARLGAGPAAAARLGRAGVLLLLASFLGMDGLVILRSRQERPGENVPPLGTVAWLKANVPPGGVIAARYREMFHWLTSLKVAELPSAADPDAWVHALAARGVRFVVNHPSGEDIANAPVRARALAGAAAFARRRLADPSVFRPVFRAPGEPFAIYELVDPVRFERGYGLMARGREAAGRGDLALAERFLLEAEASGAPLARLQFLLGTTQMLLGKTGQAKPRLEAAVASEPGFGPAARNLERLGG